MILRILGALALSAVAAFCLFGFMATFEPTQRVIAPWRIGYGLVGSCSLVGVILILRPGRKRG